MSQKLSVDNFEWRKDFLRFDEEFIQNHDEDSDKGHLPLHQLCSYLPFLSEIMKIDKCENLVCNLYDKKNYVIDIRALKQVLGHGLVLKKSTGCSRSIKKHGGTVHRYEGEIHEGFLHIYGSF